MNGRERRRMRRELLRRGFAAVREGKSPEDWLAEEQELAGDSADWTSILELIMQILPLIFLLFAKD